MDLGQGRKAVDGLECRVVTDREGSTDQTETAERGLGQLVIVGDGKGTPDRLKGIDLERIKFVFVKGQIGSNGGQGREGQFGQVEDGCCLERF